MNRQYMSRCRKCGSYDIVFVLAEKRFYCEKCNSNDIETRSKEITVRGIGCRPFMTIDSEFLSMEKLDEK